MKKNYLILSLLIIFGCSTNDDSSNCNQTQNLISSNLNINKILVYNSSGDIIREYITDSDNKIIEFFRGNGYCPQVYSYNSCNQLSEIRCKDTNALITKLSYNNDGTLKEYKSGKEGGFTLKFEYSENKVITREYRGYNINTDTHRLLNGSNEWIFDNYGNLIKSIFENGDELNFEWNNDNLIPNYSLNYHSLKNSFYLIFTNTLGRKNNFLVNYAFHIYVDNYAFYYLVENGLSSNLISEWTENGSPEEFSTVIIENSDNYVTKYNYLIDGNLTKVVEVKFN